MLQIDFARGGGVFSKPCLLPFLVNLILLRKAKIAYNFDLSECNRNDNAQPQPSVN